MRGTVGNIDDIYGGVRITPARAGNRGFPHIRFARKQDHPRACGEQSGKVIFNEVHLGSPPRVRGTASLKPDKSSFTRITPARAGNRVHSIHWYLHRWDHPRACGEQVTTRTSCSTLQGSPPRVRGTDFSHPIAIMPVGITPARAGNSHSISFFSCSFPDHPRACGEQVMPATTIMGPDGSPPRVRGTELLPVHHQLGGGITPARAGNSPPSP